MYITRSRPTSRTVRNRLLRLLPPAELERLWPRLEPVGLAVKSALLVPGALIDSMHFVEEGTVSMIATMEDGTRIEVGLVGPEGMTGVSLLLGAGPSPLEAMVQVGVAMLDQQAQRAGTDPVRDALQLAAARVGAVAQVHAAPAPTASFPNSALTATSAAFAPRLNRRWAWMASGARCGWTWSRWPFPQARRRSSASS